MIASSNARIAAPGPSCGAPSLAISSPRPPAPIPSTIRPPDRSDNDVIARAGMGAGRLGRLVTLTSPVMLAVLPRATATMA